MSITREEIDAIISAVNNNADKSEITNLLLDIRNKVNQGK